MGKWNIPNSGPPVARRLRHRGATTSCPLGSRRWQRICRQAESGTRCSDCATKIRKANVEILRRRPSRSEALHFLRMKSVGKRGRATEFLASWRLLGEIGGRNLAAQLKLCPTQTGRELRQAISEMHGSSAGSVFASQTGPALRMTPTTRRSR